MRIEYARVTEDGAEEVEDAELVVAMKEVEKEEPMTEKEQAEVFSSSVKTSTSFIF